MRHKLLQILVLAMLLPTMFGCARAARDTTGFAVSDTTTVKCPFEETWQAVKTVLREQDFDIYTRDKRGFFEAYTQQSRRLFVPERVAYTIDLESLGQDTTRISVEAVKQVYGVTLLTYPNWHDRKLEDPQAVSALLAAFEAALEQQ